MLLSLAAVAAVAAAVVAVIAMSAMFRGNRPDRLVEVGGGTIPVTTGVAVPTSLPSPDPTTGPTTTGPATTGPPTTVPATTGAAIAAAPVPTTTTTTSRPGMEALTSASTLDLSGLGPVRIGMTPEEATAAAGILFAAGTASAGSACSYATVTGGPAGVGFMLANGRIVRIEVRLGSAVKTLSGAGIGDAEAAVQARYGNTLEVSPHKYLPAGHYLTLVPTDPTDTRSRLIFETDGTKVTMFRSGTLPEVAQVEGCS